LGENYAKMQGDSCASPKVDAARRLPGEEKKGSIRKKKEHSAQRLLPGKAFKEKSRPWGFGAKNVAGKGALKRAH